MSSSFFTQIGNDIYGEAAEDFSGVISLSSDGTVLAIGAPRHKGPYDGDAGVKPTGLGANGHVRIFQNVNNTWTRVGSDIDGKWAAGSGSSLSLSSDGSIVAVGSNDYISIYKNINNEWTQIGSDINAETVYIRSGLDLSADGSVVAIGSPSFRGNQYGSYEGDRPNGYVRIYKNVNNIWTQIGADIDGEASGDESGYSVSLSSDGSVVAIGAPYNDGNGNDSGHVRIYENVNNIWTQVGADIDGEANSDKSGYSVSLSSDGSVVAIGAPYNSGMFGHVRIFKNVNDTWTQIGNDMDGGAFRDLMGQSVSLSSDGSVVAIGAPNEYISGTDGAGYSGYVRIYQNINNNWTQVGSNIEPYEFPTPGWDFFGSHVSLSANGSFVAIGAIGNDGNGPQSGNVKIYQISNSTGTTLSDLQALKYIASNPDLIAAFGIDIEAAKSHYANYGKSEGRSLTAFSAVDYLAKYSDLSAAFGNDQTLALKHYIQSGYSEGRTDSSSGSSSNPGSISSSSSGSYTSSPTSLSDFQALNYIASNSDLFIFGIDIGAAKFHYLNNGKAEGRPVDNFDEWGYLASNNDLMTTLGSDTIEAVKHYILYGNVEGRSTTIFNAQSYLNNYSDLKSAFGNDHTLAAKHYVESGFNEGRVF